MKYKKAEITEEAIAEFIQLLIINVFDYFVSLVQVPDKSNREAVSY